MPPPTTSSSYLLAELRARQLRWEHAYFEATREAAKAAELADASGDRRSWWNMTYLRAQCLCDDGVFDEAAGVAAQLIDDDIAISEPALQAEALNLSAAALQGSGRLDSAAEKVAAAARMLDSDDIDMTLSVRTACNLIAIYAERGEIDAAWRASEELIKEMDTELPDEQLAAKAYWAIGNVAFLRDDIEGGLEYHERAFTHFSPSKDLEMWGKFNKGSAAMRLAAGIADSATLRCIERAELSAEIVGGSTEDHLLLAITRAHWNYLAGEYEAAIAVLEPVCELSSSIASQNAAEAFYLCGRALFRAGRRSEAIESLDRAVAAFDQADAHDRKTTVEEFIRENF